MLRLQVASIRSAKVQHSWPVAHESLMSRSEEIWRGKEGRGKKEKPEIFSWLNVGV